MAGKDYYPVIWLLKTTFFLGTEATGQLSRLVSFPFGRESRPILHERRVSLLALAHYNYGILSWGCGKQYSAGGPGVLWSCPWDAALETAPCGSSPRLSLIPYSSKIADSRLINHPLINPWLWVFTNPWNQGPSGLSYLCLFAFLSILASRGHYVRDAGVIPGSERSPGGGRGNPVQCSRIPWTEASGRLQSRGLKRIRPDWSNSARTHHTHTSLSKGMSRSLPPPLLLSLPPLPYD